MYDNRLITIESHIHKEKEKNYTKSLAEKGWKEISNKEQDKEILKLIPTTIVD